MLSGVIKYLKKKNVDKSSICLFFFLWFCANNYFLVENMRDSNVIFKDHVRRKNDCKP